MSLIIFVWVVFLRYFFHGPDKLAESNWSYFISSAIEFIVLDRLNDDVVISANEAVN